MFSLSSPFPLHRSPYLLVSPLISLFPSSSSSSYSSSSSPKPAPACLALACRLMSPCGRYDEYGEAPSAWDEVGVASMSIRQAVRVSVPTQPHAALPCPALPCVAHPPAPRLLAARCQQGLSPVGPLCPRACHATHAHEACRRGGSRVQWRGSGHVHAFHSPCYTPCAHTMGKHIWVLLPKRMVMVMRTDTACTHTQLIGADNHQAQLTDQTTVLLDGVLMTENGGGGGNLSVTLQHQFTSSWQADATVRQMLAVRLPL